MHVVEKTTVVLTSVPRVHRVLKFTMDFVPCKLHGDDRGDNTVTTRGQPGDNKDTTNIQYISDESVTKCHNTSKVALVN